MTKSKDKPQTGSVVDLSKKLVGVVVKGIKTSTKPWSDWEDEPILVHIDFDFSNASIEDVLVDAMKAAVIRWQARMRKDPDALVKLNGTTISVDVTEKGQRGDIGPRKAGNLIKRKVADGSMSQADLLKLIRDLEVLRKKDSK